MGADRSEHEPDEPDEYDPEAAFRDPDDDSLTIPQVPTEDAGSDLRSDLKAEFEEDATAPEFSTADTDVDSDLLTHFWALVLVVNAAVLAFALSLLFLVFEGEETYSAYLGAAGLVFAGFAIRRYRTFERPDDTTAEGDDDTSGEPTADTAETADNDLEAADESPSKSNDATNTDTNDERPPRST
ncbi:DUF7322 domain-containing protein [Natronorubrum thiooxidans]|uniref:DUF7322 domain-containing protein n=1 Tax=Natronorubrum thiooxidans TaxID=308853 RepID=A0A1N7EEC8_9EURY|nr:hypothetical protein [Natronorubrum thiooxidans]SIR86523.1 hypothetical protein SAMN05421752_10417 [Natronorubrum thiooxidans]